MGIEPVRHGIGYPDAVTFVDGGIFIIVDPAAEGAPAVAEPPCTFDRHDLIVIPVGEQDRRGVGTQIMNRIGLRLFLLRHAAAEEGAIAGGVQRVIAGELVDP